MIRNFLFGLLVSCFITSITYSAESKRILIVVGPNMHPPGTYEVAAGGRLMQYCLENMADGQGVTAEVVSEWPQETSKLSSFSTIVFIGDTFPP